MNSKKGGNPHEVDASQDDDLDMIDVATDDADPDQLDEGYDETVEKIYEDDKLLNEEAIDSDVESEVGCEGEKDYDDCMYRFSKVIDEDDYRDEEQLKKTNNYVPDEDRITKHRLTKFERVSILSKRSQQIASGAKKMVIEQSGSDPIETAKLELSLGLTPFIIERPLPNGMIERWKLHELIKSTGVPPGYIVV